MSIIGLAFVTLHRKWIVHSFKKLMQMAANTSVSIPT